MTTASDTGGSPITSYNLQWDSGYGNSTWVDVVGQEDSAYLSTSYLMTAGVASGATYQFRLRAWNKWGAGGFGPVVNITASTIPDQVEEPTVVVSGAKVNISWSLPAENGATTTAYKVVLMAKDGSWVSTPLCDGAQASIVSSRTCEVAMTAFRAAPYNLLFHDLILAKVSAVNNIGEGAASIANSGGARVQTEPVQMAAPTRNN